MTLKLEDFPTHKYGTAWKEDKTAGAVVQALELGYRAFDTACQRKHYFEAGVGEALEKAYQDSKIGRNRLFVQTKFTHIGGQDDRLPYDAEAPVGDQVRQSFARSLENLRTDYLDAYVLHGPSLRVGLADEDVEAWRAMESLASAGKIRALGASNMSAEQIETLWQLAHVKPVILQNRCYPSIGWDLAARKVCQNRGIAYEGFSLIRDPLVWQDDGVQNMCARYHKTPAQVIYRFAQLSGMIILCGAQTPAHVRESLDIFDFELTSRELEHIAKLGK